MKEKSREIFGNKMPQKVYRKAAKSKKKFQKKFGDDSKVDYPVVLKENAHIRILHPGYILWMEK